MPIPLNHSRNVFYGTLPGGEIFNWSIWADRAPNSAAAANDQAQALANAFKNTAGPGNSVRPEKILGADGKYVGVKTYAYTDTSGQASAIGQGSINLTGTSGSTANLPNQCALALTLRTALAGRSHRGRVYLPITRWSLGTQALVATQEMDGLVAWFSAFLTAFNTALNGVGQNHAVIVSTKLGTSQTINQVTADNRVDIQRRRANRQSGASLSTALVA